MATKPQPSFSVEHGDEGTDHVVRVNGEIDIYTAPELEKELSKGYAAPGHVIVDLRNCSYIDSSAISALHRANRKSGSRLRIVADSESNIKRILDVTQMEKVIPVHSSIQDARKP